MEHLIIASNIIFCISNFENGSFKEQDNQTLIASSRLIKKYIGEANSFVIVPSKWLCVR